MQRHSKYSKVLLLVALIGLSCSKELSPVAPNMEPEKPILRGVQRLQGYWKVVAGPSYDKYFIADTMTSHFLINQDFGFNFRYTDDRHVIFTDSTILTYSGPLAMFYYRFSAKSDTLILSYDSLFSFPYLAIIDSAPANTDLWAPTIKYLNKTWFSSNASSHINGVDRYGDYWYFRQLGYQSSTIEVRNLSGVTVKTYTFPGVTSVDIAGGSLWTAGSYYVDQRRA